MPEEDLTTLRVPVYLVAKKQLDNDTVNALARSIIESRREIAAEFPLANQISAPSTDKDANIPIHPGAKLFFDGEEKTLFDKYGDQLFYGTLVLGSMTSALAAVWKFLIADSKPPGRRLIDRANDMATRIRSAGSEAELEAAEDEVQGMLRVELEGMESREATLNVIAARLERLIHLRSSKLGSAVKIDEPSPS